MLRLEQELFHLYPDSFGRQIAEIHTPTEFDCFGINVELKTRRELRCTQHAQAVFGKRLARHGTQHALLNVSLPSVGIDPLAGERIDPYGGQRDIQQRVLRAVSSETFAEDSLRVLRAAQFAARFEFDIDPETVELCRSVDLSDLPPERIWVEMEKLLLQAQHPSIGLEWLRKLGAIEKLFPEIQSLIGVPQDPEWHPEGDVFVHTKLVVDRARELIDDLSYPRQVTVMLASLAHDFGKPATTEFIEGHWRSRGHEEAGVAPAESFLDRVKVHTIDGYNVRAQVIAIVREHLKPGEFYKKRDEVGEGAFRRLARRCEPDLLYRVAKADSLGR